MVDGFLIEVGVEVGGDDSLEGTAFPSVGTVIEDGLLFTDEEPLVFEPPIND